MATVYVINKDGNPLMPTTRCGHVRLLLKAKQARVVSRKPFTIQLLYEVENAVQDLYIGIDPGRTNIGIAVVRENGECVYAAQVETRNKEVPKLMQARAAFRRKHRKCGRRDVRLRRAKKAGTRKADFERLLPGCKEPIRLKGIRNKKAKFLHRKRPDGWLTPTATQLLRTHINLVKKVAKILPISKTVMEINKFAFMALAKPNVKRIRYRRGPLYGFGSVEDAVFAQQEGHCIFCAKDIERYHHVVPRHKGGDETLANRTGLCEHHHYLVHTDDEWTKKLAKKKAGQNKKFGALSVLNQIIPYLIDELCKLFPNSISVTTGKDTHDFREEFHVAKDHFLDAYCIACSALDVKIARPPESYYTIRQFRRHDRQACHQEMVARKYYLGKKLVATNRHKAMEQKSDSLEEYIADGGSTIGLRVPKHLPLFKNPNRWMPGSIVCYQEHRYVLNSTTGTKATKEGRRPQYCVFTDGSKARYPKCERVAYNAGLVYV